MPMCWVPSLPPLLHSPPLEGEVGGAQGSPGVILNRQQWGSLWSGLLLGLLLGFASHTWSWGRCCPSRGRCSLQAVGLHASSVFPLGAR